MKKGIILLICLLILGWIYFWTEYSRNNSRVENNTSNININFNDFSYEKIKTNKLEINNKKIIYTWTWEFKPDDEKINKFIEDIKETKILSIASENKENFENFWISSSWTTLELWSTKISLWNTDMYSSEQYVKINWIDKIFLVNKNLGNFIDKDFDFFKKKKKKWKMKM